LREGGNYFVICRDNKRKLQFADESYHCDAFPLWQNSFASVRSQRIKILAPIKEAACNSLPELASREEERRYSLLTFI
jgi:hypothetical protein